jgi:hypothetical protein
MATTQSSFNRFQTSTPATRVESRALVTAVTTFPPIPGRQPAPRASVIQMPREPEDAVLTGGTRSLDRRLLALNLSGSLPVSEFAPAKAAPERSAPQRQSAVA